MWYTKMVKPVVKQVILLLGFYLLLVNAKSESIQMRLDSLHRTLTSAVKNDSTKTRLHFEMGREYWFQRNFENAIFHLNQSIALAKQCHFYTHQCDAYNLLAHVYLRQEKYDSVFHYLQKALNEKNELYYPFVYETYSSLYYNLGDYPVALKYALRSIEGYENSPQPQFRVLAVYVYIKAGEILTLTGQTKQALHYYSRAYQKARLANNQVAMHSALLNMAHYYLLQHDLKKSEHLYDTLIVLGKNLVNGENRMFSYEGLGNVAMEQGRAYKAIEFYREALRYASQMQLAAHAENFCMRMGSAFLLNNQPDSALYYLQQAIQRSLKSKNYRNLSASYYQLSLLKQKENKYKDALDYFKIHKTYLDSILSVEKMRAISNLDVLHRTQQKENEILRLQQSEQEKDFTIKARNLYITIGFFILLILCVIVLLVWHSYRNKQRLHAQKVKQLEQLQQVASLQSMINGQETERSRIAKDLHDGMGGLLSTVKMLLSTLGHENENLKENELFKKSYGLVDSAAIELRGIAHNMMPEVLVKLGLINAVKDLADTISAGKLLKVTVEVYGWNERLEHNTEILLYRILQELLNNCMKHANASEVIIQFIRDGNRLSILVEDNGKGFDVTNTEEKNRSGIETIKNRVAYLHGTLTIDSQPGKGTSVMIDFLLDNLDTQATTTNHAAR